MSIRALRAITGVAAAFVLVLAMSACAARSGPAGSGPAESDSAEEDSAEEDAVQRDRASTDRLEEIYRARVDSARTRFTEADVEFVTGMIAHHAQAIVMSRLAPDRAESPSVQTLAARIINAQQGEITLMEQWLRQRDQPVPEIHMGEAELTVEMPAHARDSPHAAHTEHAEHAPGMLTDAQLEELEAAWGSDFDRLFLTYMIQHHQGAVAMVDELFAQDGAGQDEVVFKLAADIHVDQVTEIARMQQMLDAMGEAGHHMPSTGHSPPGNRTTR